MPAFLGRRVIDVSAEELVPYIDWSPFFATWELRAAYPRVLDHPDFGEAARELFAHAQEMLERIVTEAWITPRAVVAFAPAYADGDDIVVGATDATEALRVHTLRQQKQKPGEEQRNLALSDFVAPEGGPPDFLGGFAVSAGHGVQERAAAFEAEHDDYQSILLKALADRLAEACAEWLHERVRAWWGYEELGCFDNAALVQERYQGIRPAPGYPACPDHTEKPALMAWLDAEASVGVTLTESLAMAPASSVCGWYFSHPSSRYFTVAPVGADQVEALASRKGMSVSALERWLAPSLSYDP